jgi:hypothetical protein
MEEADAMVLSLDPHGLVQVVQCAAAMVVGANLTGDMETLRFACSEFAVAVREIREKREIRPPGYSGAV